MRQVIGIGDDAVEDTVDHLDRKRRLEHTGIDEVRQVVQVAEVVTFKFEARAVLVAQIFKRVLDRLISKSVRIQASWQKVTIAYSRSNPVTGLLQLPKKAPMWHYCCQTIPLPNDPKKSQMALVSPVNRPCAWHGKDIVNSERWIRDLHPGHIEEIDAALALVENCGIDWNQITAADFPLPGLTDLIGEIRNELEHGCGLIKLRGLPVGRYSEDQLRKLYFGLGIKVGTPVYQNRQGELMRFIQNEGAGVGKQYGQIDDAHMADGKPFLSSYARTLSNGALRFHTDRTDVVALLCVNQAANGGVSTICSSVAVMNEMLHRRPDLAHLLFEPYYRSRHGEESKLADDVYTLPVFGLRDGRFTSHFSLTYIEAAQTVDGVPKLTDAQKEALDLLLALAQELAFEMTLESGDIQFLNSHVTYHGRTPFEDSDDAGRKRLLMRLWLAMPNSRPLPHDHVVLWRNVEAGAVRGGIGQVPAPLSV